MSQHDDDQKDILVAEQAAVKQSEGELEFPDDTQDDPANEISIEQGADVDQVEPAELAAIHTDNESAAEASGEDFSDATTDETLAEAKSEKKLKKSVASKSKKKVRSQRYLEAAALVDLRRRYSIDDALELVKKSAYAKFDAAVELHIKLVVKKGKTDPNNHFRLTVTLPHGTGKEPKIGVLDEALIEVIKQKGDTEFDILLASPSLMPKVAQIAKILGPKGKMPNHKTGTVTDDPEAAKQAILSGRIELRADAQNIIHQMIGRTSWESQKLIENFQTLKASLPMHRLQSISIAATMGPGIQLEIR